VKSTFQQITFLAIFMLSANSYAQKMETYPLPESLNEISGLEFLNETTLVAHNDGGDGAVLYILELDGSLRKTVTVLNAKNKDWEDLASDGTYLYVGDIGNNKNKRTGLCVYKIAIKDILASKEVNAQKISFSYKEQKEFPPTNANLIYDSEAIVCYQNELWIFTKTNSNPWTGESFLYKLPKTPGKHVLTKQDAVYIGPDGWWSDAITSVDVYDDLFYLTTYNRIIKLKYAKKEFVEVKTIKFENLTQKESILVKNENTVYIADEKQPFLGGGKLYKLKLIND
jgi:hypothetical protein